MCGGEGSRLNADAEKPLFEIGGTPMVERVRTALQQSQVDRVAAAVSPKTPATRESLDGRCRIIETPGAGYVPDLQRAMAELSPPLLTVAADLPLLSSAVVDRVLDAQEGEQSLTVVVPRTLKEYLGVSIDTEGAFVLTGCNVVGATDEEESYCSYDARLAVNVNTVADAATAANLAVSERTTDDD